MAAKTRSNRRFLPIFRKILSSESSRQLKALKSWQSTKKVKTIVCCCSAVPPKRGYAVCTRDKIATISPIKIMRPIICPVTMLLSRGRVSIQKTSLHLIESQSHPGGPSIIRLIHKSCKAVKGAPMPSSTDVNTTITEDKFTVSWNWINFCRFS